jgi:hypothetical protein
MICFQASSGERVLDTSKVCGEIGPSLASVIPLDASPQPRLSLSKGLLQRSFLKAVLTWLTPRSS